MGLIGPEVLLLILAAFVTAPTTWWLARRAGLSWPGGWGIIAAFLTVLTWGIGVILQLVFIGGILYEQRR